MAEVKNLVKGERILRIILGVILIIVGFYVHGFWKLLFLILGFCFLVTASIAY